MRSGDFQDDCKKDDVFDGYLKDLFYLENLALRANEILCSDQCRCNLTNAKVRAQSPNLVLDGMATYFQNCDDQMLDSVKAELKVNDTVFLDSMEYMKIIEERWNCSGFCGDTLFNRYLFSDINRGIPYHNGCLQFIRSYSPSFLENYVVFSWLSCICHLIYIVISCILVFIDTEIKVLGSNYQNVRYQKHLEEGELELESERNANRDNAMVEKKI